VVQEHAETFFVEVQAQTGSALPRFIRDEFDNFRTCGHLGTWIFASEVRDAWR
jgi:hypothetical protein